MVWGQVAIDQAQPLPLLGEEQTMHDKVEKTGTESGSESEREGGKMGRRPCYDSSLLSREEMKAEAHAVALLDSLHAFQRCGEETEGSTSGTESMTRRCLEASLSQATSADGTAVTTVEGRGGEDNRDEQGTSCVSKESSEKEKQNGRPEKAEKCGSDSPGSCTKKIMTDWRLSAPYGLVVDYAGARVRCQTTSPLGCLGAENSSVLEPQQVRLESYLAQRRECCAGGSPAEPGDVKEEGEEEKTDKPQDPVLRLLQRRVASILALKTHEYCNPITGRKVSLPKRRHRSPSPSLLGQFLRLGSRGRSAS